tara:strand:- start:5837 stop:6265 length:429 start_codon:yes stop_codon:yes gene_type:complete
MFLIIVFGSTAFAAYFKEAAGFLGLVAALIAALDLVVGFSMKARDHALLYMRFMDIFAEMEAISSPSEDQLANWARQRRLIEKDEPPAYTALSLACHNEVIRAWGLDNEDTVPLTWWQNLMMHFIKFSNHDAKSIREGAAST